MRFFTGRKDLCVTDVKCLQRLPDGSFLASFESPEPVRKLLAEDVVCFGFTPIVVTAPDTPKKVVKIFNLPFEVPNDVVKEVLARYGHVYSIRRDHYQDFPALENGTRTVMMMLAS